MSEPTNDVTERTRARLAAVYDRDEEGLWDIHGEDPNCDMGGSHIEPHLETVEGRYGDVLDYALSLEGFFNWGHGGSIRKIEVRKHIDENSVGERAKLLKKRAELQAEINAIEKQL